MNHNNSGQSLTVLILALALLTALSAVDWQRISGGHISNFNLVEDICVPDTSAEFNSLPGTDLIDPALVAAMDEVTSDVELPVRDLEPGRPSQPLSSAVSHSETLADSSRIEAAETPKVALISPKRVDDVLPIEDYSPDGSGLQHFADALGHADYRRARVAVIGDSYIEGDIFTQDIRRLLQDEYGGNGVGYMSMHTDFPGFRRSVNQSDQGWSAVDMRHNSRDEVRPLAGEYYLGSPGAVATFKGAKLDHTAEWSSTRLVFIAPSDGVVKITTDQDSEEIAVEKSDDIQSIKIDCPTTKVTISSQIAGLKVLGVWLEDDYGVGVDCMSLRGNSGITHRSISTSTAREMNAIMPYDLIIVEYGLNALSAQQSDYSSYGSLMTKVISRIRECYPGSDILMLGVGDRGNKNGSTVSSMKTVDAMVSAQRNCARECGILFWDTREAMGGVDAIVDWRRRGLVNADYIHLNHKGGSELADEFVKALKHKLNETR